MSKRTLLLADDSVTIQKVVNLTFADEGIEVVTVGDGDTAMQRISEISPDIVLADVHMPGLSGYQICEILRENPVTKSLPVILLVGSFEPFDESEAARVGANAYLTKPFQSIRQLVSQVTELMDGSQSGPAPAGGEEERVDAVEAPHVEDDRSANAPATEDIDSLYHRSVSETSSGDAEAESTSPRYIDSGMDDEMIETRVVDSPGNGANRSDSYASENEGTGYQATQPVPEFAEINDASHSSQYSPIELQGDEPYSASTSEFQYQESNEELPESGESSIDDPSRIGDAVASATSEAFSEFDEFSRTEQIPAIEYPEAAKEMDLDDMELLDLPPMETGKTREFTTTPRPASENDGKQIVTLSPEQMDMLVQKVVEKLSDKN